VTEEQSYCGWCGKPTGESGESDEHAVCARRRVIAPPRYCAACARRMVVQVTPAGWSARCSVHGTITSDAATG